MKDEPQEDYAAPAERVGWTFFPMPVFQALLFATAVYYGVTADWTRPTGILAGVVAAAVALLVLVRFVHRVLSPPRPLASGRQADGHEEEP